MIRGHLLILVSDLLFGCSMTDVRLIINALLRCFGLFRFTSYLICTASTCVCVCLLENDTCWVSWQDPPMKMLICLCQSRLTGGIQHRVSSNVTVAEPFALHWVGALGPNPHTRRSRARSNAPFGYYSTHNQWHRTCVCEKRS